MKLFNEVFLLLDIMLISQDFYNKLKQNWWLKTRDIHPISVPFSPSCQCFCWYKIIKSLVCLPLILRGFMLLDTRVLHRFFLDKSTSVSGFC